MNISRLGSTPATALPAAARLVPTQTKTESSDASVGSRPHATHHVASERDGGHLHGPRIANFVEGIGTRLQNAIDSGTLSADQVQALKDAAAQFSALMNRIDNADLANSPRRQVHFALHQLGQAFQGILHPDAGDSTTPSADAAAPSAPSIDAVA
jgi:hypothetical protein